MLISEMHEAFRVQLDKIHSFSVSEYTPEHVDILLNSAQDTLIEECTKKGLESTQTLTDYLSNITEREILTTFYTDSKSELNGKFVDLPDNYRKALMESVVVKYPDCNTVNKKNIVPGNEYFVLDNTILYNDIILQPNTTFTGLSGLTTYSGKGKVKRVLEKTSKIIPITRDKYLEAINNPFKTPDKEYIFRLEIRKNAPLITYELISSENVLIKNYRLDYIKQPIQMRYGTQYVIPTTDVNCELNEEAQIKIIDIAVQETRDILENKNKPIEIA